MNSDLQQQQEPTLFGLDYKQIAEKSDELWTRDETRRGRYAALGIRYFQDVYYQGALPVSLTDEPSSKNPTIALGRPHVDTAVAKIAGVTDTKVQFMATRSNWKQRRAIDKMEQFCIGTFAAKCEGYPNLWALRRDTMRDACIFGDGIERTYFDPQLGRATFGRVFPWEVLFDYNDAITGDPSVLFHRFPADIKSLKAAFPKKKRAISEAPHPRDDDRMWMPGKDDSYAHDSENQIMVTEFWEVGTADDPGRHILVTGKGDMLFEEEWPHAWFPFNIFHWCNPVCGMWGSSLLEQSRKLEGWINFVIAKIKKATETQATNTVVYREGSLADPNAAFTKELGAIACKKNAELPTVYTPQAFNPQLFDMVEKFRSLSYEIVGVSNMSASAQKQPGIEANSAILTVADLQSERFSVEHKSFHQGFVELARKSVLLTRMGLKGGKKAKIAVLGDGFLNEVNWPDLDIDDDMFSVQIQQAPTSKWTVASRIQQAELLGQAGVLKPENVSRVQRYADLDSELDAPTRQDQYFEVLVDRWLESTPEQRDANRVRPEDPDSPLLVPVFESVLDASRGVGIVGDAFVNAILDEVDPEVLDLFRNYLDLIDQALSAQQPPALPPEAPAPPGAMPPVPTQPPMEQPIA